MKRLTLIALFSLSASQSSWAITEPSGYESSTYESVSSFRLTGRLDSWRPVDNDTLIIWATPFRPYLVELSRHSPDLRFAETIGVTSTVGKVYAKFDAVLVGGAEYPIDAIYKLDREEAREMRQIRIVDRAT